MCFSAAKKEKTCVQEAHTFKCDYFLDFFLRFQKVFVCVSASLQARHESACGECNKRRKTSQEKLSLKILHMPNVTNESDKFAESPQNKLKCLKIKKKFLATFGCFAFCSSDFSSSSFFSRSLSVAAFVFVLIVSFSLCVCAALFVHKKCVL